MLTATLRPVSRSYLATASFVMAYKNRRSAAAACFASGAGHSPAFSQAREGAIAESEPGISQAAMSKARDIRLLCRMRFPLPPRVPRESAGQLPPPALSDIRGE